MAPIKWGQFGERSCKYDTIGTIPLFFVEISSIISTKVALIFKIKKWRAHAERAKDHGLSKYGKTWQLISINKGLIFDSIEYNSHGI